MEEYMPKWHKELDIFCRVKSMLILEGNVLDKYQYPTEGSVAKGSILRLTEYLHYYFKDQGYQNIVFYDHIRGFSNACDPSHVSGFANLVGASISSDHVKAEFRGKTNTAPEYIRRAMAQNTEATVVVMNLASRYITDPASLDQSESDGFTMLLQASMESREVRTPEGIRKNLVLLLLNKVNDVPAWFYLDNPNVKSIRLGCPSVEERRALICGDNFASFFSSEVFEEDMGYYEAHPEELDAIRDRFVGLTDGFTFTELNELRMLCKRRGFRIRSMCDVIDLYKFGVKENPWNTIDPKEIRGAFEEFKHRVKGQDHALRLTLDVIKRAMSGMTGLQSGQGGKPKGVLFFAGPTGTGKTETAKMLAGKLFGDESCCIRFDMSEYGQAHSDQKLLGAPPGYVGYEAGGQLTNAVQEHPFSILLFDEIEKAHPSVLDKFLQILEDGRMTDGRGNTVYFSETIIIFTSNLGIYEVGPDGKRRRNVTAEQSFEEVQERVRRGVEDYFKLQLGRPEILNRIGENIIVYDFIREEAAEEILSGQIEKISKGLLREKNIRLEISSEALTTLRKHAFANLENGGRGIGNIVESLLLNPLSRTIFDFEIQDGSSIRIKAIDAAAKPCVLDVDVE